MIINGNFQHFVGSLEIDCKLLNIGMVFQNINSKCWKLALIITYCLHNGIKKSKNVKISNFWHFDKRYHENEKIFKGIKKSVDKQAEEHAYHDYIITSLHNWPYDIKVNIL
jgi:hypothetical protein